MSDKTRLHYIEELTHDDYVDENKDLFEVLEKYENDLKKSIIVENNE